VSTGVRLDLIANGRAGDPPTVGLQYGGVIDPPAPPLTPAMIDAVFAQPPLSDFLGGLAIDLFTPMVDALETNLFPNGNEPARDTWTTAIRLLPAPAGFVAAVSLQVGLPGDDASGGDSASPLPALNELAIIYSRRLLDRLLGDAAAAQVGTVAQGATITSISLAMADDAIQVAGSAQKDSADISFGGPIRIALIRGTTLFAGDASAVDVDVDLPWWADLLLFFTSPVGGLLSFGLLTIIGELAFAIGGTSSAEVEAEIGAAPNAVRGALTGTLTASLSALAAGLTIQTGIGSVQPQSTPDHSLTEDGHLAVFAQVFILKTRGRIVDAVYSRALRRFREYQIEGGRWFRSTELVRLVKLGIIEAPGYNAVSRLRNGQEAGYMRANADAQVANNLAEQFE
jgi:hypothetical protein